MSSIFSISSHNINRYTVDQCFELFAELLHADARRIKLPITRVTFSTHTNVSDGGIDASVNGELSEIGDLIIDNYVAYQIKAGTTFEPWQPAVIREELLGNSRNEAKVENLGSQVRQCFEKNGTYVLVCMKSSFNGEQKAEAIRHLKEILTQCGISNPKVDVWNQENIIGVLQHFPALALKISGSSANFRTHQEWGLEEEMRKILVLGTKQTEFISTIQASLHDDSRAIHINVFGETGVGKTRLVFEAMKDKSLAPTVMYFDSPRKLIDSQLFTDLIRENKHAVLVVDECNLDDRTRIWNSLSNLGHRIKLITIYNEYERTSGSTNQISAPNLDDEQITQIIQQYYNDNIIASQLSRLCDGIPRFAHVIGWDLRNNPSEILHGTTDTANIFERYITYGDEPNSTLVIQRRRILLAISLFKKFGYGQNFPEETTAVHTIIQKMDNNITLSVFKEHVNSLRRRKVLQGEDTLYISPKALHLWLWMKFWESYGASIIKELPEFPPLLQKWFFAMFEYAGNSDVARSVVQGLFQENGPLHSSEAMRTGLGSEFFYSLSLADPSSAISHLEGTIGTWSKSELEDFTVGRRDIIRGLERIIFEPDLFNRGGRILRSLAENENEQWSNNATGIFVGMFSLGPGYVSLTKTPPSKRIPLLKETLCTTDNTIRQLGLKACDCALEAVHFIRSSGLPSDELRIEQKGWEPKTRKEWKEAYVEVVDLLVTKIQTFPKEDQQKGSKIIFDRARGLIHSFPSIGDHIVDILSKLRQYVDEETALRDIIGIMEYDKDELSPELRSKFKKLRDDITGFDYGSLMHRYVAMDRLVDLADKNRDKERDEQIKKLAKESLDVEKLKSQLSWLVTIDAKNGLIFGYELSAIDTEHSLLPTILDFQKNASEKGSGFFLGGYLLKISETNPNTWTKTMMDISSDQKLLRYFAELAFRSGITDEIAMLLLDLIKEHKLEIKELNWFVLGSVTNRLSTKVVTLWIEQMLDTNKQDVITNALAMFDSFFIHRQPKSLDEKLTLRLLTHDVFFGKNFPSIHNTMLDYYWQQIGFEFCKQFPEKSLILADKILESMDESGPLVHSHSQVIEVLDRISKTSPNEVWELVTKYVYLPYDERGYAIVNWMRGDLFSRKVENTFLEYVDFQKIFDWIDHDPHRRASFIAEYAPPVLKKEHCLVRELLIRYGADQKVHNSLFANFSTGGFSGSGVLHYGKIKEEFVKYKESEENENVLKWINSYIESLDNDIKREKLSEERLPY